MGEADYRFWFAVFVRLDNAPIDMARTASINGFVAVAAASP
ncbi:hypothetical protein ACVDG5_008115 [Mesorhizobium sp. ORM6]